MEHSPGWLTKGNRIVIGSEWVALVLGVLGSSAAFGSDPPIVATAALLGGGFVLIHTFTPLAAIMRRGLYLEILVIAGVVLTIASVTLTGGMDSSYVLLALMPTLLGSIAGGYRIGITTSLFSAGLIVAVTASAGGIDAVVTGAGAIALFPLLALLVAQIRNLLVESEMRAISLEEASVHASAELQRMTQANDLLRRLTDVYGDGGSNPVEVSRSALEAIVDANRGSYATATLFDAEGPVTVARVGTDSANLVRIQLPLGDGETTSGVVSLGTQSPLTPSERADVNRLLRPVAVSFANTVLLQDIAKSAVSEERLRVARELHDEIGPALAALGLSLDVAAMHASVPETGTEITDIRLSLGEVLEDVRLIIADLRAEPGGSLTAEINRTVGQLGPPPEIEVDVHERRPPRASAGRQIAAMVTESVRNASRHADASHVSVTGTVDRSSVSIEIRDDGRGFDVSDIPEGHFGLLGMRERADRIGATIEVDSGPDGTAIRLTWKDER
ncbi:hypothetical protein BH23ACT5_BH23ACT5_24360 [soil metagenome]